MLSLDRRLPIDRQPYVMDMNTFGFEFLYRKLSKFLEEHDSVLMAPYDSKRITVSPMESHFETKIQDKSNDDKYYNNPIFNQQQQQQPQNILHT